MIAVNGAPLIENWEIVESKNGQLHVKGEVFGHDVYDDSTMVITSRLVDCIKVDYADGVKFRVKTKNSVYQLSIEYGNDNDLRKMERIAKQLSHEHEHEHEQEED